MLIPEVHENAEARRIALGALEILSTPSEERFDRIARLTSRLLNTRIVQIGFPDYDRHWYKVSIGLDLDELPRVLAPCAHAEHWDEILVVEDASVDERFAENPLVVGNPGIRLYIGVPIRCPNGHRVGTFAAMDTTPRAPTPVELDAVSRLGGLIETELSRNSDESFCEESGLFHRDAFLNLAELTARVCHAASRPASAVRIQYSEPIAGATTPDEALRHLSEAMRSTFRSADLLGRLTDSAFGVILAGTSHEQVARAMERLTEQVNGAVVRHFTWHHEECDLEAHPHLDEFFDSLIAH